MNNKRILIIKPSALGDIATTLPLLCDLHAAYPDAHIDWLIHPPFAPLVENHDALHALIPFDRKKLSPWWYKPSAFRAFTHLLKTLRANRYDIVIDAQGLLRSAFLTRITRAKIRIGFAHAREGAPLAYTHKVKLPDQGRTMLAVERMRALSQPLNIPANSPAQFRVPIAPLPADISTHTLPPSFIAMLPGARWNTKRWPIDRYAALAAQLLAQGEHLILMGSSDEKLLCDELYSQIENRKSGGEKIENLHNLAGQTSIATLIGLLARAKLVIANDSGPLHIAAALGTPLVALYGPTSPSFVGPYNQLQSVLRHHVPCHPCRRRECDHHSCMNGLNVELVWEKTRSTLLKTQQNP